MFTSFFPRPRLCFLSALVWVILSIGLWYGGARELGGVLGLAPDDSQGAASAVSSLWSGQSLWHDLYFWLMAGLFAAAWRLYAPHSWSNWSIPGSALIVFATYFQVEVSVAINRWYGPFYDLIQAALAKSAPGREAIAERDPAKLDLLIHDSIADLPNSLTCHEATFERRDLIEAMSNALVGTKASAERADQEAKDLIDRGAIVPLGSSRNGAVYSTPEMIEIEARLVKTAAELANAHVTAPNADLVHRRCIDAGLSEEQAQVALAATSGSRLVSISGPAGTGKTKSIEVVARSWEAVGYRVIGSSVGWLAALAPSKSDGVNIPSRAIDSWLKQSEDLGKPVLGPTVVCIIDESSLTSSIQCARVLDAVKRAGPDSVLAMVGDSAQIRPIGPAILSGCSRDDRRRRVAPGSPSARNLGARSAAGVRARRCESSSGGLFQPRFH
jgi:hypothetical protein